jgi:large subunit ribosomal protein L25
MKSLALTVFPRAATRRPKVKQLRAASRVPAVIYGRHRPQPQNLEIKLKELEDLIHHSVSENILVDLKVEGDPEPNRLALVQAIQHHPLSGRPLHVDFHEVAPDERVVVSVPVEAVGEPEGVKDGGVLEHVLFKLRVRTLPKDMPEVLAVDVSHLKIGQAVHLGEIKVPAGTEILGDKHISVLAVSAPIAEEVVETPAAETGGLEPEVIGEKKEEGEEGEGAEKGEKAEKGAAKPAEKAEAAPEKAVDKKAEKKAERKK